MDHNRHAALRRSLTLVALLNCSFVSHSILMGKEFVNTPRDDRAEREANQPLSIRPLATSTFALSPEDDAWVRQQIQPCDPGTLSPSYCLHVLRAHGLNARFENASFPTSESLLAPVLDTQIAKAVFGKAALVPVSTGARYQSRLPINHPRWREFHRDQNLSAFAELGLPLSTKLSIDGQTASIADVLKDSLSTFHLKQEEIEWTALAYAIYLPPNKGWSNRYGEHYSFDDLTNELLKRPMVGSSCGGTHLLYSLTFIARADEQTPILSEETRQRLRGRLTLCIRLALASQQPDGSWLGDWFWESELSNGYRGPAPVSTPEHVLTVTGHLAEWMLYLPADTQAPEPTLQRASAWLLRHLKGLSEQEIESLICPCAHGICVLRHVGRMRGVETDTEYGR